MRLFIRGLPPAVTAVYCAPYGMTALTASNQVQKVRSFKNRTSSSRSGCQTRLLGRGVIQRFQAGRGVGFFHFGHRQHHGHARMVAAAKRNQHHTARPRHGPAAPSVFGKSRIYRNGWSPGRRPPARWAASCVLAGSKAGLDDGIQRFGASLDLVVDDVLVILDRVGDLFFRPFQAAPDGVLALGAAVAQAAFQLLHVGRQHKDRRGAGVQTLDVARAPRLR